MCHKSFCFVTILFLALHCNVGTVGEVKQSRQLKIFQGQVRGYKEPNKNYYSFYGIPYATAPVGELKFKDPLYPSAWLDVFEATNKTIICPQRDFGTLLEFESLTQREDCLIANVFVPDIETEKPLPVLVYIHGGAYMYGFGAMTTHENILNEGIIVVNFNYRLSAHGFLCLGTSDVPGNAGLKDMLAALRWVKNNIAFFGGNANDVTLGGFSAGAAAAELLMLVPKANGLFNKVILESGSTLGPWAIQMNPINQAWRTAQSLGFSGGEDVYALEQFYKKATLDVILPKAALTTAKNILLGFVPCIEQNSKESILFDQPINIINNKEYRSLPLITGFSEKEGLLKMNFFDVWKDDIKNNFEDFLPLDLKYGSKEKKIEIAEKIKQFYFSNENSSAVTAEQYVNYFGDTMFEFSILESARLHSQNINDSIYLYRLIHAPKDLIIENNKDPKVSGAGHCAQTFFIHNFDKVNINWIRDAEDEKTIKSLVSLWANFIKTGKPEFKIPEVPPVQWESTGPHDTRHLSIGTTIEMAKDINKERYEFLKNIYDLHRGAPIPPPFVPSKQEEL